MKRSRTVGIALAAMQRATARRAEDRRAARAERLAALPAGLAWHVGVTAPGSERAVEAGLIAAGALAYCPLETVSTGDRARRRDIERALMPRYVFFAMTGDMIGLALLRGGDGGGALRLAGAMEEGRARRAMRRAMPEERGVMGIDGLADVLAGGDAGAAGGRRWKIVPAGAVEAMLAAERGGLFDRTDGARRRRREAAAERLVKGDSVRIVDGILAGTMARVLKVKGPKRLTVLLELFGSGMRAELTVDSLAIAG